MTEPVQNYRLATIHDAQELLRIYAPYIATSITFECTVPSLEEFQARIQDRCGLYPYIVVEEYGHIVGYAYASRLFAREAYEWSAELSVYMSQHYHGKGLGRALYERLLCLLELQGVRSVHGKVTEPNEKSDRLHLSMGFRLVGVMDNVGFKCGHWRDVAHYEKLMGDFSCPPSPLIPLKELDQDLVKAILRDGAQALE